MVRCLGLFDLYVGGATNRKTAGISVSMSLIFNFPSSVFVAQQGTKQDATAKGICTDANI